MVPRGRSHTKPGSLLKSQIPVRTWADWDESVPGFVEIEFLRTGLQRMGGRDFETALERLWR